jgi:hypothetical protein
VGVRPALLLVAGLTLVAGCTGTVAGDAAPAAYEAAKPTVPVAGPGGADPAAPPVVGTCYDLADGQEYEPLDPPSPVSCGEDHNAETATVGDTGLGPADERPSEDDLYDDDDLSAAVWGLCGIDVVLAYLGGEEPEDLYAYYAVFLPDADQWDAGARWLRCDVHYGYSDPETAPGVMAGALDGPDAAAYRVCLAGTARDHVMAPCSEPHGAEPAGYSLADLDVDAPYPDEPTRLGLVPSCAEAVQDYLGGPPPFGYVTDVWVDTAEDWGSSGEPRCVLVPAGGGSVTGTVHP